MDVTIVMLTESFTLRVNPQDTVGSLKTQLQEKLGVSSDRLKLLFDNGHRTTLSDDSEPLSFYSLHHGCQVSLLVTEPPPTIEVFLKNDKGKMNTYVITPDETVSDFKTKVEEREGVAVSQQRLVFQGRDIVSGKLSDYKVGNHSTVEMVMRLRGG